MGLVEMIGFLVLAAVVLLVVFIIVRRAVLIRAGGFDVSWRCNPGANDRGWLLGQARYRGDELGLYRSFSPLPTPALTISRASLQLGAIRPPVGEEPELLPPGVVIVPGSFGGTPLELALTEDALTALRAWVESRPPGSRLPSAGLDDRRPEST